MNDLDLRLHHHIAQEIYRQQMLQRLPGKNCFASVLYIAIESREVCIGQAVEVLIPVKIVGRSPGIVIFWIQILAFCLTSVPVYLLHVYGVCVMSASFK